MSIVPDPVLIQKQMIEFQFLGFAVEYSQFFVEFFQSLSKDGKPQEPSGHEKTPVFLAKYWGF
jgi:hypothetical protein